MDTHYPDVNWTFVVAREVIPAHGPLAERLRRAHELYLPDLIICHRDAETMPLPARLQEIQNAEQLANLPASTTPAIPVKMLESWLLADDNAIRQAANNRNGTVALNLPAPHRIEFLNDPKQELYDRLRIASELPPQRLRKFNVHQARSRVSDFMKDFTVLRLQHGFLEFEESLRSNMNALLQARA